MAYLASAADLHFRRAGHDSGDACTAHYAYGELPGVFPELHETLREHWSYYGKLE